MVSSIHMMDRSLSWCGEIVVYIYHVGVTDLHLLGSRGPVSSTCLPIRLFVAEASPLSAAHDARFCTIGYCG